MHDYYPNIRSIFELSVTYGKFVCKFKLNV